MSTRIERAIVLGISADTKQLAKDLQSIVSVAHQATKQLGSIASTNKQIALTQQQQTIAVQQLTQATQQQHRAQQQAAAAQQKASQQSLQQQQQIQKQIASTSSSYVGLAKSVQSIFIAYTAPTAVLAFLKNTIQLSAEMERIQARFETFTGSASLARQQIGELKQLSALSGMSFGGLSKGASTMMSYGVDAKDTMTAMKSIATITNGDVEAMQRMAVAYSQVMAAGRLYKQEVNQMINAGFNPLMQIAKQTGMDMQQLKDAMRDGAISAEMVAEAFKNATSAGGQFDGMLERIANTNAGRLARMANEWEQLKIAIGDAQSTLVQLGSTDVSTAMLGLRLMFRPDANDMIGQDAKAYYETYLADLKAAQKAKDGYFSNMAIEIGMWSKGQKKSDLPQMIAMVEEELKFLEDIEKKRDEAESKAKQREMDQKRVEDTFGDSANKQYGKMISAQYGDKGELVQLLRDQSVAGERQEIDRLIAQKASYDQILSASNQTAQNEARKLSAIMEQTKAIESQAELQKEQQKLADEAAKKEKSFQEMRKRIYDERATMRDSLTMTKEQARIQQLIRSEGITKERAKELQQVEKQTQGLQKQLDIRQKAKELTNPDSAIIDQLAQLEIMKQQRLIDQSTYNKERDRLMADQNKAVTYGAAPSASAGSAQAAQLMIQQLLGINNSRMNIDTSRDRLAKRQIQIAERQKELLEEISDKLPQELR